VELHCGTRLEVLAIDEVVGSTEKLASMQARLLVLDLLARLNPAKLALP